MSSSFRELHRPGHPFVLPNAWDVTSARAFAAQGFPAVGTTSLGVSAVHGLVDGAGSGRAGALALAAGLQGLGCPVTVDLEDGFSADGDVVARLVADLHVAGVNLEDSTADTLVPASAHAAKVAAVKAACPDVFVNARVDAFWLALLAGPTDRPEPERTLAEVLDRAAAYVAAGADGIFVPGDLDAPTIAALTRGIDAPVNILAGTRHTRRELAALGVARISTGSLPYRAALAQALVAARCVRDSEPVPAAFPYAEVQRLNASSGADGPREG